MLFRRALLALLLAVGAVLGGAGVAQSQTAVPAPPASHALLIGVTHYPNLTGYGLEGPANDVLLMQELLCGEKFRFPQENVVVLSEAAGAQLPERLPTRANIEREFRHLAEVAQAGGQIVIFMAGHGSQQPEDDDPVAPELDGLNEIFLPRDVGKWEGEGSLAKVANAIADDELGQWLKAIQAQQAAVWVLMDSCHSGTMIRGIGEAPRQVPSDAPAGLNIPRDVLEQARRRAAERLAKSPERTRGGREEPLPLELASKAGLVAIYACQPNETTVERALPLDSPEQKPYGLLTYTLSQVLTQANGPITYHELLQQIQARYVHMRRTAPTPMIEGPDQDREVLGAKALQRSKIFVRETNDGLLKINAGKLHGLTADSILAVFPPPGQEAEDQLLGHVRITKVQINQAEVTPCEYEGVLQPQLEVLIGGRCEPVLVDHGDAKLRVALDLYNTNGQPLSPDQQQRLTQALAQAEQQKTSLIQVVAKVAEADWIVRWDAGKVQLISATEAARATGNGDGVLRSDEQAAAFHLSSSDEPLDTWLPDRLSRIARAENLLRLATNPADAVARRSDFGVNVIVEIRRLRDETDGEGEPVAGPGIQFKPGEIVQYLVSNPGSVPIDVTLLYVDSQYGIEPLFPFEGEDNRFQPGDKLRIPPVDVTGETNGREHLVVIAVKSEGERADFSVLAQPTIERTRGPQHPLWDLCRTTIHGMEGTRGSRRRMIETYAVQVIPLDVEPSLAADRQ